MLGHRLIEVDRRGAERDQGNLKGRERGSEVAVLERMNAQQLGVEPGRGSESVSKGSSLRWPRPQLGVYAASASRRSSRNRSGEPPSTIRRRDLPSSIQRTPNQVGPGRMTPAWCGNVLRKIDLCQPSRSASSIGNGWRYAASIVLRTTALNRRRISDAVACGVSNPRSRDR